MLESLIAVVILVALVRYVWVAMLRNPVEHDIDAQAAIDSVRANLRPEAEVEVRASDFSPLDTANEEVSRRPRLRAGTTLPTIEGSK